MSLLLDISGQHYDLIRQLIADLVLAGELQKSVHCERKSQPINRIDPYELDVGVPGIYVASIGMSPTVVSGGYQDLRYETGVILVSGPQVDAPESRSAMAAIEQELVDRYNGRRVLAIDGVCELETQVQPGRFSVKKSDVVGMLPTQLLEIVSWIRKAR